jgi:hypothetical protein
MRVYNIEGPDGRIYDIEGPDGASDAQVIRALKTHLASIAPVEGPKPEKGLLADVKSSAKNLLNIGRTGLGALTGDTTAAAMEGAKRQEEAAKAYTPGFQPQKIVDKFNSGEYLGAAGEAISQVPSAIAGLLPSVGQEIGSAALGRLGGGAAGALLPIPGGAALGATVGQYAVPLIVNAIQALGSQAQEKVQTQIEAGEKPDVNALELAPYAAANAAANLVGTRIAMPGIFKKAIGLRVAEESGDAARAALMAEATKTAGRGTMAAIGYGTGRFAIGELPTEIFQDVIDRAAIGKPLADDEAITQYRNTALNMALAAPLGGGFALKERSNARDVTAQQKIQADAEANLAQKAQQDAAAAQLEAGKQTPEYAKQAEQAYFAAEKTKADLLAQIVKRTKDKPLTEADKQANTEITAKLKENAVVLENTAKEYRRVKPILDAAETSRMQAVETAAQTDVAQTAQQQPYFEAPQATLPGMDAVEQPAAPAPDVDNQALITEFATKQQEVRRLLEYNQTAASDAASDADTAAIKQLSSERKKLQTELDYVTNKLTDLGGDQSPENAAAQAQKKLDVAKKKLKDMAGAGFDPAKADRLVAQIDALEEEIKSYGIPKNAPLVQRSITEPGYIEGLRAQQQSIDKDEAEAATNLLAGQKPTVSKDPLALLRQSNEDLANANVAATEAERAEQIPFRSAEPGTLAGFQPLRAQEALPEPPAPVAEDTTAIDKLIATLPQAATVTPGQIRQGLGGSPQRNISDLKTKQQIARLTGNKEAEQAAKTELEELTQQETKARGAIPSSLQTELGFGTLAEGRATEANADMQADKQNNVLVSVIKILNSLRFNRIPGTLTLNAEKAVPAQLDRAKEVYAAAHQAEINERRKAFGIPEMATWEAADARARVMEGFSELEKRWNTFESRQAAALAIQEQMRNNITDNLQKAAARLLPKQTAELAEKTTAPTGGKRIAAPATLELKGTPYRASNEKQDALNLIETVLSTVKTRTRAAATNEKAAPAKVGSLQDIARLFAADKSGGVSERTDPATQSLLEQLAEALPKINDPEIITLAREQAQQIMEGNLPSPNAVLELQAAMKFQEKEGASATQPGATAEDLQRTSAQPQLDLFGPSTTPAQTLRSTSETFQKLLDSKTVDALRGKLKKVNDALKKQTQNVQNALRTAVTKHNQALKKAKAAKETVALIGGEPVWFAPAVREVVALETELQHIPKDLAELRSLREGILTLQGDPAAKQMFVQFVQEAELENTPALRAALNQLNSSDPFGKEIAETERYAANAQKMVINARARFNNLLLIENASAPTLLRIAKQEARAATKDAEKAKADLETARQKIADAVVEVEPDTTQADKAAYAASAQAGREGLDLPGIRVTEDTAALRNKIKGLRSKVGSISDRLDAEKDPAKKAELQTKLDSAQAELEGAYVQTPRLITEIKPADEDAFYQAVKEVAALAERPQTAEGEVASRLPARRVGPVEYAQNRSRVVQTGPASATAQIGSPGVASIEALADKRAALAEVQRRQGVLRTNRKDKVKGRLTETMRTLKAEAASLQKEVAEIGRTLAAVAKEKGDTAQEITRYQGRGSLQTDATVPLDTDISLAAPSQFDATRTSTPLSAKAVEMAQDGRILDLADELAKNGSTPAIRATAAKLRPMLMRTKLAVDKNVNYKGESVAGLYDPQDNTITMHPEGLTEEDVLHEMGHAATDHVLLADPATLTADQRAARKGLEALHASIAKSDLFKGEQGTADVREFAAEVTSNNDFRNKLDSAGKPTTLLQRALAFIKRMLGMQTEMSSKDAQALVDRILAPSRKLVINEKNRGTLATPSYARTQSVFIGSSPDALTTFRGNFLGLAGRVQYVDSKAAREEAFAAAEKAGKLTNNELFQATYFMRMADKVSQAVGQFLSHGPLSIVRDPKTGEYGYSRKAGATMVRVAELAEQAGVKDVETLLTTIAAGQRADAVPNGWERLSSKYPEAAKAEYKKAVAYLQANPTAKKYIDAALLEYKQFNSGLLDFAEQHDLLSASEVARLKKTPFVPFYRVEDGVVKLYSDSETAIRIGDITNDPELIRMMGSDQTILPIFTSAVQNAYMLTRLSMQNKESLESSNALFKAGFVSKMGAGQGLASKDTVHYRIKGEPHFATIDSDTFGIPANLIVAGMAGIKTTIPLLVRAMGYPADLVRKFVTRAPVYPFRQLVRDPINAAILSGVDGVPVLNALKELGKMRMGTSTAEEALSGGLVVSSNVFSGNERDMQQFIESIATGKNWWKKTMGALDKFALQSDAATRATVYQDGLKKGLSEFRAQLNAAESQNFGRHGLSPSMHYLSTMVPFFNSQVQGLDVLYRALRGKLPFSEQLELKRKLYARGMLLTVGVMAYAAMMQDDEAYKKATPQERYSNLFLPLPGFKEPLKIPIPYEVGVLFVALPQMVIDMAFRDTKARDALKGISGVLWQSVPGVIPAGVKPVLEGFYGATSVGPIESEREKQIQSEYRFKDTTPEALRIAGSVTGLAGVSAIMLTHLVRGYTGSLGVALLQVFDPLLGVSGGAEKASVPLNKQPLIGGAFQSAEGRGFIDAAYDHMDRIQKARQTYVRMVERGERAEAAAFAQRYASELAAAAVSGQTYKRLGDLYSMERKIRAHPTMTTAQKDTMLDKIKTEQNRIAVGFERVADRTTRP